ncbi:hypothetical protein Zmor_024752 [Zophobas morio]|uniref:Uncharacterized protein n=1 Tax=Zophobas morio TaxID=2755281 RepID=A0AA38I1D8_9CUCU|nr:hypothetical protein Zmor_024752 [Zophobas morio]
MIRFSQRCSFRRYPEISTPQQAPNRIFIAALAVESVSPEPGNAKRRPDHRFVTRNCNFPKSRLSRVLLRYAGRTVTQLPTANIPIIIMTRGSSLELC